jgi:hypothetical protein
MINMRRVVLVLPIYVVTMTALEVVFRKTGLNTKGYIPLWLIVVFTLMALACFIIVAWFLTQKVRGKIAVNRERGYLAVVVAVIVSGFVSDGLRGLATLVFHGTPIWFRFRSFRMSYCSQWAFIS